MHMQFQAIFDLNFFIFSLKQYLMELILMELCLSTQFFHSKQYFKFSFYQIFEFFIIIFIQYFYFLNCY